MGTLSENEHKLHAVCVPYPAMGHFTPMLDLAMLLHHKGFHITFVNTDYIRLRLLKSCGPTSLDGWPGFRFATIPDGLPLSSDDKVSRDVTSISDSTSKTCLEPFCELLTELNNSADVPAVSCIVADGVMSFTLDAAERFGLPEVLFWTPAACGFLAFAHYKNLVEKGYVPLKDKGQVANGYLETIVDWIPGMKNIRLKDFPTFIRTTDPKDPMINFLIQQVDATSRAKAVIVNSFDDLERDALTALSAMFPPIYTIGPLHMMLSNNNNNKQALKFNLWKEESQDYYMEWLDSEEPGSVLYVNFGSSTVMSLEQLTELAWGLANSKKPFLWIIRPDLVTADASAVLPPEFMTETKDRSMIISWCNQGRVLKHPAIGGFLTHCGWNSTIESIGYGVPMICWPYYAEQQTNCRYSCVEWEIGLEICNNDVKRGEVELLVQKLMNGEKGKGMKKKAAEWKGKAEEAIALGGSSYVNLDKLISDVLSG